MAEEQEEIESLVSKTILSSFGEITVTLICRKLNILSLPSISFEISPPEAMSCLQLVFEHLTACI